MTRYKICMKGYMIMKTKVGKLETDLYMDPKSGVNSKRFYNNWGSTRIRNKARISSLTTPFQHGTGSIRYCNKNEE